MTLRQTGLELGLIVAVGCVSGLGCLFGSDASDATDTDSMADASSDDGSGTSGELPDGVEDEVMTRWLGVWSAYESSTSGEDRLWTNLDIRPVNGRTLFGHIDFFGGDTLRFAFSRETHHGDVVLVFRDREWLEGVESDTRSELVEADLVRERFRWCSIDDGCAAFEASLDFRGPDALTLDIVVDGAPRFHWDPERVQKLALDGPFPVDDGANPPDAPFPDMPTLRATLSWDDPLIDPADVWIILSTQRCWIPPGCAPARFQSAEAPPGAIEIEIEIEKIHAGDYFVNAILDRDRNVDATLRHDPGDAATLCDRSLAIASEGVTETEVLIDIEY